MLFLYRRWKGSDRLIAIVLFAWLPLVTAVAGEGIR
jgi:hypothetical protein